MSDKVEAKSVETPKLGVDKAQQLELDDKPRKRRTRRHPDRLTQLPIELLHLIVSHFDLASFLSVSLVSKPLRTFVLSEGCEAKWLNAIRDLEIPELEAKLRPVELATLVVGRSCRVCGKKTARKVDFHLRCRLCSNCWKEEIVYEGPDEPDPAFEGFFAGTKRYTPRARSGRRWKTMKIFFFLPSLEATSAFLSELFEPQIDAYEQALETDPLAEINDFTTFKNLPPETQTKLDERQEWVKRVARDGDKLTKWYNEKNRSERNKKKEAKARERTDR
ncbi:hypothetical protein JCM16303_001067 [Sporobolomyces ruberrimus]